MGRRKEGMVGGKREERRGERKKERGKEGKREERGERGRDGLKIVGIAGDRSLNFEPVIPERRC